MEPKQRLDLGNIFMRAAVKLEGLLKAEGIVVVINPEKPRKGFFEVRTKGKKVVSLGPMPRPFKALRALEMDDVAKDVIAAIGK